MQTEYEHEITKVCQNIIDADKAMWAAIEESQKFPELQGFLKKARQDYWALTIATAPPVVCAVLKKVYSKERISE